MVLKQLMAHENTKREVMLDHRPLTKEEAKEIVSRKNKGLRPAKLEELIDDVFEAAANLNIPVTRMELSAIGDVPPGSEYVHQGTNSLQIPKGKEAEFILPVGFSVTPFPNLKQVDPSDIFDLQEDPMRAVDPNSLSQRWFETPRGLRENQALVRERETREYPFPREDKQMHRLMQKTLSSQWKPQRHRRLKIQQKK